VSSNPNYSSLEESQDHQVDLGSRTNSSLDDLTFNNPDEQPKIGPIS
jgi:hypothetical protein